MFHDKLFRALSLVGLFAVFMASGGLKSNQNVFGGNQFRLPEEQRELDSYFSVQYFAIKCGLLVGQITIPIMRHDVQCFGMSDCYPLAFGFPAALMFIAFVVMLCGKSSFVHIPPSENMVVKVSKCIAVRNWIMFQTRRKSIYSSSQIAIKLKLSNRNKVQKLHWLENAEEKCGEKLVMETKKVLSVLTMFLPLPLFWALYGQHNSRFVLQASMMNGDVGLFTIKPDQMVMSATIFIIILIPLFENLLYPLLAKIGIKSSLHKVTCGFISAALAFVCAAIMEKKIDHEDVSILWLLPQFLFIAFAETFLWVSIMSFVYTQAPDSMKSVLAALLYITIAFGSLIVVVVSSSNLFECQVHEYLFYVVLMIINTIAFSILAQKFKSNE